MSYTLHVHEHFFPAWDLLKDLLLTSEFTLNCRQSQDECLWGILQKLSLPVLWSKRSKVAHDAIQLSHVVSGVDTDHTSFRKLSWGTLFFLLSILWFFSFSFSNSVSSLFSASQDPRVLPLRPSWRTLPPFQQETLKYPHWPLVFFCKFQASSVNFVCKLFNLIFS